MSRHPERAYSQALVRHEKKLLRAATVRERELADPGVATSLGLPADLPGDTRAILAQAHALSKLGPARPKRSDYESPDREESPWAP